jgi:3-(3-hydroxy-phenyl)propionate hydroxylase
MTEVIHPDTGEPCFDVGIVGFGPVGAAVAALLGRMGVSTVVVEKAADIYPLPRAVHFDDEAMRVFQAVGVADRIAAGSIVNLGMRFIAASGQLLIDWPRPQDVGPQGWHASYRFHQPDIEAALRGAAEQPCNRILLRHEVFNIEESGDGVRLHFEDLSAGRLGHVKCRYLVGCDGARSTVRRFMGLDLEDLGFHQRWLVVDVILKRAVPELSDWTIQYCDPERPTTVARGVGLRRRWEFKLLQGEESDAAATDENVWRLLSRWIGPDDADIERAAVYTFHSAVARSWRKGRLILAGDAAHQTPPFLGQGLCAGIRDAANLCWKLAFVLKRGADEALLSSYETERSTHAREYIDLAVRLGELLQGAGERDAALPADSPAQTSVMRSIQPRLGPGLHTGLPEPAGRLAAQPQLSDGRLMDDVVGLRFALLLDRALFGDLSPSDLGLLHLNDVVALPGEASEYCHALGARAVLIRPDRYILGCANTADQLSGLLARMPVRNPCAAGASGDRGAPLNKKRNVEGDAR